LAQRDIARALVARADTLDPGRILDLGAGAGHVTGFAREKYPRAQIHALDAAPKMLARLRAKFPEVSTICADATDFAGATRYDLIFSSMMAHWLPDPRRALENWRALLAPGGVLLAALPVAGSLEEWRRLLAAAGLSDSLWSFPPEHFAKDLASEEIVTFAATYPDARAFALSLKKTGAHRGRPGRSPASASALRRALAAQSNPFTVTFKVAMLRFEAGEPICQREPGNQASSGKR
jgi:trans-aconitate methyltransferase